MFWSCKLKILPFHEGYHRRLLSKSPMFLDQTSVALNPSKVPFRDPCPRLERRCQTTSNKKRSTHGHVHERCFIFDWRHRDSCTREYIRGAFCGSMRRRRGCYGLRRRGRRRCQEPHFRLVGCALLRRWRKELLVVRLLCLRLLAFGRFRMNFRRSCHSYFRFGQRQR